jgi:rSAM-associated Gly-rich repeat protein
MMMEEVLALRQKYREIVSKLMTPGAIGMAVLLGSTAPGAASQQPSPAKGERVSERLAAIRDAVSAVSGAPAQAGDTAGEQRLAWGNWHNGGWGGGGWGGGGWGGGGYGYGIPYVAPWGNWRNGWNNWRNGWGNW